MIAHLPPQPQNIGPCQLHLHPGAVLFSFPSRLRAEAPQFSLSNSQIYRNSLRFSYNLNKKTTCKLPRGTGGSNEIDRPKDSAAFFDEHGTIEDMDGYLNYLSLEYDSVWDTKPSWCQPWTIISTGVLIITGSWLILHSPIVTGVVLSLICAWWYIFLFSYPQAYSEMIADRRKRVRSGAEDIYGSGRPDGGGDDSTSSISSL